MIYIKIIACIKQVPGTTEVKIDPETNTLVREGIENIINPFDSYAVEEAVRLKERFISNGCGKEIEVIVITMGPPQAEKILRDSIALGSDRVIILTDKAFAGSDTLATSSILCAAIKKIGDYSIILCGKQSMDGDTGQVGPELAQKLNIPFAGHVSKIDDLSEDEITYKQLTDNNYELIKTSIPTVLSVLKEINEPRIPSLKTMIKAKNMLVEKWGKDDINVKSDEIGLEGSATRVVKIFTPQVKHDITFIEGQAGEQADKLYDVLKKLNAV